MPEVRLTVPGPPRTKKTHNRIIKVGGRRKVLPSQAWERWCHVASWLLRPWVRDHGTISHPVNIAATFYRDALTGDAVGYYQGLADLLQHAGVVSDDKYLVSWDGSRLGKDAGNPRTEVVLSW